MWYYDRMSRKSWLITFIVLVVVGLSASWLWWIGVYRNGDEVFYPSSQIEALPKQDISETERDGLVFMREEEKLARDVYTALYEKWGVPIFKNISRSEQTHTDAIRSLLEKYQIADPAATTASGVFVNQDLQKLYTVLVTEGETSLVDALRVGALIEDLDIVDLQKRIGVTDNADVIFVYENLMKGSRNHLRSFVGQLTKNGATYEPAYLSAEEYVAIINSPRETGPMRR